MRLLLLFALLGSAAAECPASHEELPTLYDDTTFNCAIIWMGKGDDSALNSCKGCYGSTDGLDGIEGGLVYYDGYDEPGICEAPCGSPPGADLYIGYTGSFMVKPGCTLTVWEKNLFNGEFREFDGTLLEPNNNWGIYDSIPNIDGCAYYYWNSFKCRCQQKMLDCVPEDGWSTILECDNVDGIVDTECEYQLTLGTTWSESTSNSFSIDAGVEYAISAGLFGLFSNEIGVSSQTGYDWTDVSEVTTSDAQTFTVRSTAPAGYTLVIEQAIGHCTSGSSVEQPNTELFKTSTLNKLGEVVSVRTERVDVAKDLDHWKNWNPRMDSEPESSGRNETKNSP